MHFKEHLLHPLNSGFASASPKALALQAALQATTQLPLLVIRQSLISYNPVNLVQLPF